MPAQHYEAIPSVLDTLLKAAKTSQSPSTLAAFIGTCVDVSIRLKPEARLEAGRRYVHNAQVDSIFLHS